MRLKDLVKKLVDKYSSEENFLLGEESQFKLSPIGRKELVLRRKIDYYPCGAMIFLFENDQQETQLVLFQRQIHDGSAHSGQIGLPAGKYEQGDQDIIHTAIRETHEEIGVLVPRDNIIGSLTPLKIPVSGYELFTVIGFSYEEVKFTIEPAEVDHLIFVPIDEFINSEIKQSEFYSSDNRTIIAPHFEINGSKIWGSTAMILSEFRDLVKTL